MINETIEKFGYPGTALAEYDHWVVLLRPKQVTAGSLVLACKEDATAFAQVTPMAYSELSKVTGELETALNKVFHYEKINYLALMMVDNEVHFHVLPRYSEQRQIAGVTFIDTAWPKPADIARVTQMTDREFSVLYKTIKDIWH